MSSYILDKAYSIDEGDGVGAYRVVVAGTNAGEAQLPSAANVAKVLGVTTHSQTLRGGNVAVRKAGIARCIANGPIALGAPVNVAGNTGKVKAITEAPGSKINCIGFAETEAAADGELVEVFLQFHQRVA